MKITPRHLYASVLMVFFGFVLQAQAQERVITGRVVDQDYFPLMGASVVSFQENGTQGAWAIADEEGNFTMDLSTEISYLQVSYVGFKDLQVKVTSAKNYEIVMEADIESLQEVVVTALGMKRDKKALGYSVEKVDYGKVQQEGSLQPLEALSGQVAGLNVQTSGSGMGGSTNILLRGANSLTGNNQPLIVIDGVPIDNSGGASVGAYGGTDYGNAANNINPDDIQDVSVLKGGAAAALYGSRGQNGVIMITTKSGKGMDKMSIDFSSGVTVDKPMITPGFQNTYAQGSSGKFNNNGYYSWGPKMTGQQELNFLGESQTLNPNNEDPADAFFNTATTYVNSLALSKSFETSSVYFSATNNNSENTMPNSTFDKTSLNLRVTTDFNHFFSMDTKVNLINQDAFNRPNLGGSPDNPMYSIIRMPRSVTLDQMNPYATVNGYPVIYTNDYIVNNGQVFYNGSGDYIFGSSPLLQNPYWAVENNTNEDTRNRIIGYLELSFDLKEAFSMEYFDSFTLKGRTGMDYYIDKRRRQTYDKTNYKPDGLASLSVSEATVMESNTDLMATALKTYDRFSVSATVGANLRVDKSNYLNGGSSQGIISEYGGYYLNNFNNPTVTEGYSHKEMQSVFGMITLDYDRKIYLDLTARNDWASTLSKGYWSFFYPSASLSFIINEMVELPEAFNFLKFRTSYAQVGGDPRPNQLDLQYTTNPNQYFGFAYGGISSTTMPNPYIQPEKTNSFEAGFESKMFDSRLGMDFAFYHTGTSNQIFAAPVAPSSGFDKALINAGLVVNQGMEFSVNYQLIEKEDFSWNTNFNISKNWSEVKELTDDVESLTLVQVGSVKVQGVQGQSVGQLIGTAYRRDDQGNIMLDDNNLPMYQTNEQGQIDENVVLGNVMPTFQWGWTNSFRYKHFNLGVVVDSKWGHDMFSYTNSTGAAYGTLAYTTDGRDDWAAAMAAAGGNAAAARNIGGYPVTGSKDGFPGTYYANPQQYWERLDQSIDEAFVYDASYIRLQRVSFGYTFDRNQLTKLGLTSVSLSAFANNLGYLYSKTPNVSPESSFVSGSGFGGIEMYAYPETTSIGFMLNVKL